MQIISSHLISEIITFMNRYSCGFGCRSADLPATLSSVDFCPKDFCDALLYVRRNSYTGLVVCE